MSKFSERNFHAVQVGLLAAAIMLSASGCVTSTLTWNKTAPGMKSSSGKPVVASLKAMNSGLFLFYYIPIWSGEVGKPNRHDYETFKNQVKPKYMYRLLSCRLKNLKADSVEDVTMKESSTGAFGLWILWKRSIIAEGLAVKNSKVKK